MLVLSRKKGESIIINDNIEITVVDISGPNVRIGIKAPNDMTILRRELYLEVQDENRKASSQDKVNLAKIGEFIGQDKNK